MESPWWYAFAHPANSNTQIHIHMYLSKRMLVVHILHLHTCRAIDHFLLSITEIQFSTVSALSCIEYAVVCQNHWGKLGRKKKHLLTLRNCISSIPDNIKINDPNKSIATQLLPRHTGTSFGHSFRNIYTCTCIYTYVCNSVGYWTLHGLKGGNARHHFFFP